jgi:hypothetical protein
MTRAEAYSKADIERLLDMMRDGRPVPAMAAALARSEHSIRVKISRLRRLLDLPRGDRALRLTVTVPGVVVRALHLQAEARGLRPDDLAAELLTIIVKDDLVLAVLGDDA